MLKDKQHLMDTIIKTNCIQGENLKIELYADRLLVGNRHLSFMEVHVSLSWWFFS